MSRVGVILGSVTTQTLTQADADALGPVARPGPTLIVIHGPDPRRIGDRLSLDPQQGTPTVIGRRAPSFGAAALGDPRVSSQHLRVTTTAEGLRAEDLGSKNGTFVRDQRVESAILGPGDRIQIGGTILQFAIEAPFRQPEPESLLGGISEAMAAVRTQTGQAASHALPVLIVGPSGAGKERAARELHRLSDPPGEFVALNCATLSPQLAESELFGHRRGAFTGADRAREGLFQKADRGTLFLDEINSLPLELQPKLLRAIQEGKVRPVGATEEVPCRPRILCATNEDPTELVAAGRLREDLYARLHGGLVSIPSLRARSEDIGWLAHTLLHRAGHPRLRVEATLMWALLDNPWPLNVRSLEQCLLAHAGTAMEDRLGLSPGLQAFLDAQHSLEARTSAPPTPASAPPGPDKPRKRSTRRPARDVFEAALRDHLGRVERVADHFGVRRQQIYRWVDAHGLNLADYREPGDP